VKKEPGGLRRLTVHQCPFQDLSNTDSITKTRLDGPLEPIASLSSCLILITQASFVVFEDLFQDQRLVVLFIPGGVD
jgi:hypothetical protein